MPAGPGPAHRDDADLLVGAVPELGPDPFAIREGRRVEAGDVAGEVEVLPGPLADPGQALAEPIGHDVGAVPDEDGPVAHPGIAVDVLDHLGVVVGGQESLPLAALRHRQPADEVGQPGVGCPLLLRVLVQVIVDLPGFVPDPEVVFLVTHDVQEEHEVGEQDLVHPAPGLEAVEIVLAALAVDVVGFAEEQLARRVHALAVGPEHLGHRVLRQPVDLEVGVQLAQLVGDGDVALGVAEPNG